MTPSDKQVKRQVEKLQGCITLFKANSPTKSPTKSPTRYNSFLTKDSNLTGFVAFDVDGRVGDIESQFKELKAMVDTTLLDRKGMDDALELAKKRGMNKLIFSTDDRRTDMCFSVRVGKRQVKAGEQGRSVTIGPRCFQGGRAQVQT